MDFCDIAIEVLLSCRKEACEPWTGTVPVECVVGRVKLTNAGKMPAASRAVVDNLVMTRL